MKLEQAIITILSILFTAILTLFVTRKTEVYKSERDLLLRDCESLDRMLEIAVDMAIGYYGKSCDSDTMLQLQNKILYIQDEVDYRIGYILLRLGHSGDKLSDVVATFKDGLTGGSFGEGKYKNKRRPDGIERIRKTSDSASKIRDSMNRLRVENLTTNIWFQGHIQSTLGAPWGSGLR